MNPIQLFALIPHESRGEFWYELVTMRRGELVARRSLFSIDRGRIMADKLADRYAIDQDERHGMYCGSIIRTGL